LYIYVEFKVEIRRGREGRHGHRVTVECEKPDGGRDRPACPDDTCGFIHYGDFSIGCAGVVMRDGKALLVQRGWQPGKGSWQIPGGYAEHDEPLVEAVEREVLEAARTVGGDFEINPTPQEVSWTVPLDQDDQHRRYDLCPACVRKFLRDPLGKDAAQKFDFSEN